VKHDRGQATVELALTLPFLCMLVLGVVQVAVLGRDRLAVQLAAREAARASPFPISVPLPSPPPPPPPPPPAATGTAAVALRGVEIELHDDGESVRAIARYTDPTDVPLIGMLLPDITVQAEVVMAVEPP
jgi:TadE-like protein